MKYKQLTSLQIDVINSLYRSKQIIRDCERRQKEHDKYQRDFENNNVRIWEWKNVSGIYNGLYKGPRALYTKMSESFIYFETTGNTEVKSWIKE